MTLWSNVNDFSLSYWLIYFHRLRAGNPFTVQPYCTNTYRIYSAIVLLKQANKPSMADAVWMSPYVAPILYSRYRSALMVPSKIWVTCSVCTNAPLYLHRCWLVNFPLKNVCFLMQAQADLYFDLFILISARLWWTESDIKYNYYRTTEKRLSLINKYGQ